MDGYTPLTLVGCVDCARILLDHGANIDHETPFGSSLANRAAHAGNVGMIEMLIARGAKFKQSALRVASYTLEKEPHKQQDILRCIEMIKANLGSEATSSTQLGGMIDQEMPVEARVLHLQMKGDLKTD